MSSEASSAWDGTDIISQGSLFYLALNRAVCSGVEGGQGTEDDQLFSFI